MYGLVLTIHILVCVLVVLIVLVQAGRSGGFSGLMGGGGGDALFSTSSQQSGLRKATVALAATFMATSLFLTLLSSRRTQRSVFQQALPAPMEESLPAPVPESAPPASTAAPAATQETPPQK